MWIFYRLCLSLFLCHRLVAIVSQHGPQSCDGGREREKGAEGEREMWREKERRVEGRAGYGRRESGVERERGGREREGCGRREREVWREKERRVEGRAGYGRGERGVEGEWGEGEREVWREKGGGREKGVEGEREGVEGESRVNGGLKFGITNNVFYDKMHMVRSHLPKNHFRNVLASLTSKKTHPPEQWLSSLS